MHTMAKTSTTKIQKTKDGHHTIYLKKELITDSTFPMKVGEDLDIRIEDEKLVIEHARK